MPSMISFFLYVIALSFIKTFNCRVIERVCQRRLNAIVKNKTDIFPLIDSIIES